MNKNIKRILLGLLAALVIIQFIRIDKSNPTSDPSNDIFQKFEADEAFGVMVKDACYDCHSNQVEYPWYANIQPVGWWIKGHVNEGVGHLNFSEFATYNDKKGHHKLEECVEMLEEGEMPLKSFTWTHPESRLTDEERTAMIDWFKSQMATYNLD